MEDLRHSLHRNHASATLTKKNSSVNGFPTKTAYDDVFGGPPKFSVPYLPSRIEDYGEIFGGFYAPKTSSIPFLDFPAAEEDDVAVDVRSSNFAYSEVFGGFSGGDFAVSYEELFMEPKGSESASTDDWIPAGADSFQQTPAVVTRDPLEQLYEDPFAYSEKNQFMPEGASHHGTKQTPAVVTRDPLEELHEDPFAYSGKNQFMPDGASHHGTKQFSVSYHKTSHRTKEDAINGATHIAQLHVVPGYTSFVDACSPSEKAKSVKTMPQLSNDSSPHVDFNEGTVEGADSGKTMLQNPSGSSSMMKTSGNDVEANQKQFNSENSALEDASANNQHHLHYSSSNHLISDGDRSYHDGVFLSVSEINLRTQPSHVPPPSRPPPKFVSRQGHSKGMMSANLTAYPDGHFHKPLTTDQVYPFGGGFETYVVKEAVKDISPTFFDVEVDLSSAAAAASAAAMKAMEQAQVRLKSAKESMERKRSNLQNCKKLGLNGNIKGMEKREKNIVQEAQKFKEGIVDQKAYEREKSEMKDFDGEEKRKATREALVVPDFKEKGRHIELDKEYLEKKQMKDSRIALDFFKPEESMGEWKAEKQFYELVKNEKKFKVAEPFGWESNGSKLTEMAVACEKKQKESIATKDARKSDEAEGKLRAFQEGNEQEENDKKLKAAREACQRRENEKILREPLEALEREENEKRLKAAQEALEQEKNRKKTKSVQEALGREEDEKKLKAAEEALKREENEQILKAAQEVREQEENKKKLKADQEALVRQENDKKLKAAQEALVREENEKKQKAAQEALVREENEKKLKAAQVALVQQEKEQKLKAAQEALVREENEKKQKAAQEALMREENAKKLKMAQEALVRQENEKKLKAAQEALVREENEKKQRAVQVALEREENAKKLKATQEALVRQENERKLQAAQEALVREEHEKKLKAAQEALETEKKLKAAQEALIREEHEKKLKAVQEVLVQEENEKNHKVAQQTLVREENEKKLKAAQEIRQRAEKEKNLKAATVAHEREKKLKADCEAREQDEKKKLIAAQEALGREENNKELLKTLEFHEHKDDANNMEASNRAFQSADSQNKEAQGVHEYKENENKMETVLLQDEEGKVFGESKKAIGREENEKKLKTAQVVSEQVKVSKMLKLDLETHEKKESEKNIKDVQVSLECEENKNKFKVAQEVLRWIEKQKRLEVGQQANVLKEKGNILKTALGVTMVQDTRSKEKNTNETHITEERDKEEMTQREKEHEVDRLRKIEEEREREREREKDRIAVERATREARERFVAERLTAESRERAAVERVTAEARQRAMSEARERAEKASAEAREKLFTEKTSMETRLRVERAAVERATAEARERAVEKAMAEKAARDRQKKDSEMEGFVGVDSSKDGHWQTYAHNQQFQSAGSTSSVFQRYSNHASYSSEKFQGAEGESATRCKARLERHQRTTERAAKALAEKNMRDVLAQREQAERNRLAETLDADVRRWSNGKEGNLRALLSTLQYILGPDSGWQPIPLTDVITAVAVKKAYRKATLCVHPDKLQQRGASIQQKYVCEKVFDLLKEAWNKFNSEER